MGAVTARAAFFLVTFVLALPRTSGGQGVATVPEPSVEGVLRLESFPSRVFGNARTLRVLLPDGYDAPAQQQRRYPVLYLNDGQNLFDAATSTFNRMEWRVDETVRALVAAGRMREIIVVGIDHAGRRERFREYFPYVDAYLQPPEPNPQGRQYPTFLIDEVVPFIEARYRADRDPAWRGVGGSSAGALAALYTVIARPGVFGRLLVESPSLYVDDTRVLKEAEQVSRWPERVAIGAGTAENARGHCGPAQRDPELVRDVRRFADVVVRAGVSADRVRVTVVPCAQHNEEAWAARLPEALTFLYSAQNLRP
jgi:predicted alpha/beta superfamily hydrolase